MRPRSRTDFQNEMYACFVAILFFFSISSTIAEPISISLIRPSAANQVEPLHRIACTPKDAAKCRSEFNQCLRQTDGHWPFCARSRDRCLARCGG